MTKSGMTMGRISIKLDPTKLSNPDLDLRYVIPDRVEALTDGAIRDDGYDYLSNEGDAMIIFLESQQPREDASRVVDILQTESFLGNDLYAIAVVAIDVGAGYEVFHPQQYVGDFVTTSM
jgi:myo-inositol-hexaphosphate 3-phosphohydrolase